jgi:hypothetical protein
MSLFVETDRLRGRSCDEGLTIRLDELNVAYLRDDSTLYMVQGYP